MNQFELHSVTTFGTTRESLTLQKSHFMRQPMFLVADFVDSAVRDLLASFEPWQAHNGHYNTPSFSGAKYSGYCSQGLNMATGSPMDADPKNPSASLLPRSSRDLARSSDPNPVTGACYFTIVGPQRRTSVRDQAFEIRTDYSIPGRHTNPLVIQSAHLGEV